MGEPNINVSGNSTPTARIAKVITATVTSTESAAARRTVTPKPVGVAATTGRVGDSDTDSFANALSVSGYDLKRQNLSDFPAEFDAQRVVVRLTAEREGLILGAERQATEADLSGRLKQDLSVTSAFGVARTDLGPVTLTASARYDEPDHFKGRATGRLSAKAELGSGFALTASAGQ